MVNIQHLGARGQGLGCRTLKHNVKWQWGFLARGVYKLWCLCAYLSAPPLTPSIQKQCGNTLMGEDYNPKIEKIKQIVVLWVGDILILRIFTLFVPFLQSKRWEMETSCLIIMHDFYHGLLPERQSHGHEASCFFRGRFKSERLRENKQSCYWSREVKCHRF